MMINRLIRYALILGFVTLTVTLLASLIGHAAWMFGRYEHTGISGYADLLAFSTEGGLAYVTIALIRLRMRNGQSNGQLRAAQMLLIIISAYMNYKQATGGVTGGDLLDQLVVSVTLPIILAVLGEIGYIVIADEGHNVTQPVTPPLVTRNETVTDEEVITPPNVTQASPVMAARATKPRNVTPKPVAPVTSRVTKTVTKTSNKSNAARQAEYRRRRKEQEM